MDGPAELLERKTRIVDKFCTSPTSPPLFRPHTREPPRRRPAPEALPLVQVRTACAAVAVAATCWPPWAILVGLKELARSESARKGGGAGEGGGGVSYSSPREKLEPQPLPPLQDKKECGLATNGV